MKIKININFEIIITSNNKASKFKSGKKSFVRFQN